AGRHDVIPVPNRRRGLGLGAARNRVMLTDRVAVADPKIAALPFEIFVERVRSENRAGGNLVTIPKGRPTLDEHVRLQKTVRSDRDVGFNNAELADARARPNY